MPLSSPPRLLKKVHLLRWRPRPHAQRRETTPRVLPSGAASHLRLFEQPGRVCTFCPDARNRTMARLGRGDSVDKPFASLYCSPTTRDLTLIAEGPAMIRSPQIGRLRLAALALLFSGATAWAAPAGQPIRIGGTLALSNTFFEEHPPFTGQRRRRPPHPALS